MRDTMPSRVVFYLVAAFVASQAGAQGDANATVCAATDDSAFSPEQRIAACDALINAARNAPKEVADALVNRGQAAWYADKMKQAFADLDRAIALDPNNARAFRERSNAYRSIGKLDSALADASEAVRLDPRDAKAFDYRGDVFVDKGKYDRAIQDYDEALRLDPKLSLAFRDRGAAYYFNKDYERAIKDYDEAIKLDPRSDRARQNSLRRLVDGVGRPASRPLILDQPTRHDHPHDLVRPLENLVHAKIPHQLLDAVVGEIAVAAEQLQSVVGRVEPGVGGDAFGHGAEARRLERLLVERARRPPQDRARSFQRSRDVGDPKLQRLEIGDPPPERLALAHVGDRLVERRLSAADRTGADVEAPAVKSRHGDLEAVAFRADKIGGRHARALHDHLARRLGAPAHLLLVGAEA
jgi:tetratricopeptide (TPR) repeat protein